MFYVGTLFSDGNPVNANISTVTDNLFSAGTIPENLVAVSFEPPTSLDAKMENLLGVCVFII